MLPLEGIRVCDFTWVWAGPFCTLQLAHLGAEVIKIESSRRSDTLRRLPSYADNQPGLNRAGYFNQYNQGKRSLALDITSPEGREIALRLAAASDIVSENFAPGVMQRLGLDYDAIRKVKPDIIMISLSGYGATGPLSPYIAYGPAQVPMSGLSSLTGFPGGPPTQVGLSYGDPTGGIQGTVAVLAALWKRMRTGEGQYIDESQWEAAIAMLGEGVMEQVMNGRAPERAGNRDPVMAPHGTFRCTGEDEAWVSIACGTDEEFAALCRAIGRPELAIDDHYRTAAGRKANEGELESLISEWARGRDRWDITRTLQAMGVAAFPSMSAEDLSNDAHLNERGIFVELEHPEVGVRRHIGIPYKMSGTPVSVRRPAPVLGQHTDDVLREILNMDEGEIAALRGKGVLQ
ncbi:MAG: CoA transferase [Chloroflexi bacterium]|nr:CoA transferase [Chloroflexota bacterium]